MTEQKLCRDCKYYRKDWLNHFLHNGDSKLDRCVHPVVNGIDPVTGQVKRAWCEVQRDSSWSSGVSGWGKCKEEGLFWEKK